MTIDLLTWWHALWHGFVFTSLLTLGILAWWLSARLRVMSHHVELTDRMLRVWAYTWPDEKVRALLVRAIRGDDIDGPL